MAFAEVVPALNNGVVDCGVTGSLSGNTAGWTEVTKSIYPMSLGWSINVLAVNLDSWKRLDPKMQAFLLEQVKAYEDKMWATRQDDHRPRPTTATPASSPAPWASSPRRPARAR